MVTVHLLLGVMLTDFAWGHEGHVWPHSAWLDRNGSVRIQWRPEAQHMAFHLEVATKGYVGFGFSPNGGMRGSDIFIGWIKDGTVHFNDRFATGLFLPEIDKQNDWEVLSAHENDTHTVFELRRKLMTCDDQDLPITDSTTRIIYSYHPDDPVDENRVPYHTKRGGRSIYLMQPEGRHALPSEDVMTWDAVVDKFSLPTTDTMYWCKIIKGPDLGKKHHIFKVEPLIQPGNEGVVHHIVLFRCIGPSDEELEMINKDPANGHECYHPNMPPEFFQCDSVYAAWGVGGESMVLPDDAGLPIGEADTIYFMLQMHYDNPSIKEGIVDSSGLRIFYTPHLKKYDASVLALGGDVEAEMIIPPGRKEYVVTGHCHPQCLAEVIPPEGMKIVAGFLHAHVIGVKMVLRHFRNNVELRPIVQDQNYDFNYQEYKYLPQELTILPGDQLTMECTYDSSHRNKTTLGGLSTREEMCLVFLLYYPHLPRSWCMSVAPVSLLMGLSGVSKLWPNSVEIRQPAAAKNQTYFEYLIDYPWDPEFVDVVEKATRFSPHVTDCRLGNGKKMPISSSIGYPKHFKPYLSLTDGCPQTHSLVGMTEPTKLDPQTDESDCNGSGSHISTNAWNVIGVTVLFWGTRHHG